MRLKMNRVLINLCAILLGIMVLEASWQVITRYVLNSPATWTDEMLRFQLIWLTMVGAALAHGMNRVMAVTMFVDRMSEKSRNTNAIFVECVVILFSLIVLVIGGFNVAINASTQVSASLGINMFYVYLSLPVSGILFIIYAVFNLKENLSSRKGIVHGH